MQLPILTVEVGSTITKANGFELVARAGLRHVAQGFAATTVDAGDVGIGVDAAIAQLTNASGYRVDEAEVYVNSSAAGGLRMTVHGLTRSMTARAAREAALGAGAIVRLVTAGPLGDHELAQIRSVGPNIILLAGGVDDGEREPILRNAKALASLALGVPVVYAGNAAIRSQVYDILSAAGVETHVTENVFPEVDVLNVDPVRRLIHEAFNRHIVHAPGMAGLKRLTSREILPTPGAVLLGAQLFTDAMGDCVVVDVGGATTDVHSVTDGSLEWAAKLVDPEPRAKRTVEGDLGVYVNAHNVVDLADGDEWRPRLAHLAPVPGDAAAVEFTRWLRTQAVQTAVRRHAGTIADVYTPTGRRQIVKGKDLTAVRWLVGTGGALTRIPGGEQTLRDVCRGAGRHLLPPPEVRVLIDRDYLFSALGTLAHDHPEQVRATFAAWACSAEQP